MDSFETDMWGQVDQYMGEIAPGNVSVPNSLVGTMAWVSGLWTSCFNALPSDFQFVFTFSLVLGHSLLVIGRGAQTAAGMQAVSDREYNRKKAYTFAGNSYVNGRLVTVIDDKYFK